MHCALLALLQAAVSRAASFSSGSNARGSQIEYPLPYAYQLPSRFEYGVSFPPGFMFGAGTSSFQVEGAWDADGKGLSIWDVFTGADGSPINPGMADGKGQTASISANHYHKVKEDVQMLKRLGFEAYRFSIAWPRILPNGTIAASGGVAEMRGINFYNALIDRLIEHGIEPVVSLYHWDLPQALLDDPEHGHPSEYRGWLDDRLPRAFADYADLCFRAFGDRVKQWYTFNEPWTFVVKGYTGGHAPSLCNWKGLDGCFTGDRPAAGYDVYAAAHNVLRAHALAVSVYREHYQRLQEGTIGISLNSEWKEPATSSQVDIDAASRAIEFELGWFADPIYAGDYPASMRAALGDRLPNFTAAEADLLRGSADTFGLNAYTSAMVFDLPNGPNYGSEEQPYSYYRDCACAKYPQSWWPRSNATWLRSAPWGLRKLLKYIDDRYHPGAIFVTENGWAVGAMNLAEGAHDPSRILYLSNYTSELAKSVNEDGVPVKGYYVWSLMDNYEWEQGYTQRFGITFVNFEQPSRPRYIKTSACWFREVIRANAVVDPFPFTSLNEHKASRRPSFETILAGKHALPVWQRGWDIDGNDGDEIDVCFEVLEELSPFSWAFFDNELIDDAFVILVAVICIGSCAYVNRGIVGDLKEFFLRRGPKVAEPDPRADQVEAPRATSPPTPRGPGAPVSRSMPLQ
eukprot:CAMPEP_0206060382 /NCGR_PEP_ID=MMETSP1466-20131121/51072_1 /ASSEMBLY_ACC=CAM_ASM_001126 /TAXON_ID=44452 /ORGANISM="Pavlova gyrans, Strain CCMP608" /LENGTH=686 /DNA_ID=CAMNT_0053435719 /DNA_START=49 /DNA_END=2109 /DNA_ORIENTATION=+